MQRQKAIEQLGYSPKEAKVYLATLELGEATISDIAEKVDIPRSSAQVIIDKLNGEGVVNFYVMRRYKYWVAENPERLLTGLMRREEAVRNVLPRLAAMREEGWNRKSVRTGTRSEHGRALFRMIADASEQPILIANAAAEIEYVNAPWEEQFGYALEDVRGQNPKMFKSGKTPERAYRAMWEALENGRMFQSDQIVERRKDGTDISLLTTIFPVRHGGRLYFIQVLEEKSRKNRVENLQRDFVRAVRHS